MLGVIPGSMASPTFVARGKGNAESLNSASHGAGRVMSRNKAQGKFQLEDGETLSGGTRRETDFRRPG